MAIAFVCRLESSNSLLRSLWEIPALRIHYISGYYPLAVFSVQLHVIRVAGLNQLEAHFAVKLMLASLDFEP